MKTRNSKTEKRTKEAFEKGCRVTRDGEVIGLQGFPLKLRKTPQGYLSFSYLSYPVMVHRLAALQWIGNVIFIPGVEVRHLDGNPLNNTRENIRVGTPSENQMDRPSEDRLKYSKNAASHKRKLTDDQLRNFREDRKKGASYKTLCAKYEISKTSVSYIVNNKTYQDET